MASRADFLLKKLTWPAMLNFLKKLTWQAMLFFLKKINMASNADFFLQKK